jgi:hypothetical protein
VSRLNKRLLPLFLLVFCQLYGAVARAQLAPPRLNLGDAVVSGFSGVTTPDPAQPLPANKSAVDLTFINPDGPSARIIDIDRPGYVWDGRLFAAPKIFDVHAKDVGQVFGVALDDQASPNIYVAATSAFGLNIVSRGSDGLPERRKKGGPGAGWMKGQFGLDLQGGPGAIYKVDGGSGAVTLFANVTLDGVPNPGTGLGSLAYDAAHKQLFASDLYTGMIHRFDLSGNELGHYDHGVAGLGAVKLATVPFDPKNRPNIASAHFDSENPDTWGFAPAARRVWAVAVHAGRLYYSVASGPQIWSVGIAGDGSFAADPRLELAVPVQAGTLPVSDMAFSQQGAMILAQRALIAAAYDYSAFTQPGEPRVLRFWPKDANDPPSPGLWKPAPDEYAVGFAGDYRNTNGGVALGYGYGADGMLNATACEGALWTTGQNLRNNPALRGQLEPGGPLVVHGLQGSPADLVRNANTPPTISYFVDYDDKFDDPLASGHIGVVRVFTTPCAATAYVPPIAAAAPASGVGCVGPDCRNACTPTCMCPPGTVLEGRECVKRDCPDGQIFNPATGSCMCPPGTILEGRECAPIQKRQISCRPPLVLDPITDTCVPQRRECPPPLVLGPTDTCICPPGAVMQDGKCVPQICPPPLVPGPCKCPEGTVQDRGLCVPLPKCPPPQILNEDGVCMCPPPMLPGPVPGACICPRGSEMVDGQCVTPPKCPPPQILNEDGICMCPPPMLPGPVPGTCVCPQGSEMVGGKCVTPPKCPPPLVPNADGICGCPPGTVLRGKECVRPIDCRPPLVPNAAGTDCVCKSGLVLRRGSCVEPIVCNAPATLNSAGTGCTCPRGMISKGNTCVEPQHNPRTDSPLGPGFHERGGEGGNPFGGHGGQGGGPRGGGGGGTFGR